MKSKPMGALLGILALVAVIAIAPQAFAATAQVTISKGASITGNATACGTTNCFNPNVININVGDKVTWTNTDSVPHTSTYNDGNLSDSAVGSVWDSSMIKAGSSYTSPPFTKAGTYNYFCEVHPWMAGQVIVGASATSPPPTNTQSGNMTGNSTMSGNQTVPEFGPVASLVLVIAIISVIAFTAKTRGLPKL
ncbi:MAG: cupredoxin domain-containing protein [Thaumarchaeota archaeon]|nr:cupredoxin domain-containing protein [Nitrososphaerota archaeon]